MPLTGRRLRGHVSGAHGGSLFERRKGRFQRSATSVPLKGTSLARMAARCSAGSATRMPLTERRLRGNVSGAHGASLFGGLGDEHATDRTSLTRERL
jgi:hypothetical protein